MGWAQSVRDAFLTGIRGTQMPAWPANLYVALLTTNPTDETGTGLVEVSGTGYARQAVPSTTVGWTAPSGTNPRQISNAAVVNYGTSGSAWGTVTGFALYDAVTAGTFKGWAALTGGSKVINNGDPVSFAIGALLMDA